MENSNITNNGGNGIEVSKGGAIHHSNIHGNTSYDITMNGSDDVDASLNWWGTTDANLIESKVYDYYDDYNLGKVNYVPMRTSPNTGEPVDIAVQKLDSVLFGISMLFRNEGSENHVISFEILDNVDNPLGVKYHTTMLPGLYITSDEYFELHPGAFGEEKVVFDP